MNILYILQQSIYNNNGKWLTGDSNIQMMRGVLRELIKKTDWNFYVLIADIKDFANIKSYKEIFEHKRVHFIPYDFPINAFLLRQNFNVNSFDSLFKKLPKIDIVWNNISEISRNIKTFLKYYVGRDIKLITCCYWLDTPMIKGQEKIDKTVSYDWRQFDGFECSDLVVFTCKSTLKAFIKNAKRKFNNNFINKILKKSTIWDFGYSIKELNENKTKNKFTKKTIMFLNRLSDINYTHHKEFIVAVNKLSKKREDFNVVFTNPSMKIKFEDLEKNVRNIYLYSTNSLTRKKYIELLWRGCISVHLYTKELYGGCASREAIECNNIIITPKVYEYRRILGEDYDFYISPGSNNEYKNLYKVLSKALDRYDDFIISDYFKNIKERNRESSFEYISNIVKSDIEKLYE